MSVIETGELFKLGLVATANATASQKSKSVCMKVCRRRTAATAAKAASPILGTDRFARSKIA